MKLSRRQFVLKGGILVPATAGLLTSTRASVLFGRSSAFRFNPLSISGLQIWHEGRFLTGLNDGDGIASITDFSGNGYHATQATGILQPTYQTNECNGYPVILGDGSTTFSDWTGGALGVANNQSGITVYAVVRTNTIAAGLRRFLYISNGLSAASIRIAVGLSAANFVGYGRILDADALATVAGVTNYSANTWYLVSVVFDATNADMLGYVNGTIEFSNTSYGTAGNISATDSLRSRFESSSGVSFWSGDVAALLVYRGAHGTTDRQNVDNYLESIYNVIP